MHTVEDVLLMIRAVPEATDYANKALASLRAQGGLTPIARRRAELAYRAAVDSGQFSPSTLQKMAAILYREDGRKKKNLVVRLSAEDYERLRREADDLGVSLSDVVRERLRLSPEPPYDY